MSIKWKVPMPKEAPKDGKVHFAYAFKMANGQRIEYVGQIAEDVAIAAMNILSGKS